MVQQLVMCCWLRCLSWNYFIDIYCLLRFSGARFCFRFVLILVFNNFLHSFIFCNCLSSNYFAKYVPFLLAVCTFAKLWPPLCNREFSADSDKGLPGVICS